MVSVGADTTMVTGCDAEHRNKEKYLVNLLDAMNKSGALRDAHGGTIKYEW